MNGNTHAFVVQLDTVAVLGCLLLGRETVVSLP